MPSVPLNLFPLRIASRSIASQSILVCALPADEGDCAEVVAAETDAARELFGAVRFDMELSIGYILCDFSDGFRILRGADVRNYTKLFGIADCARARRIRQDFAPSLT